MRHFSCDLCGKDLTASPHGGADGAATGRYVLRMEVAPAAAGVLNCVGEADLDRDQLDAMAELLDDLEADPDSAPEVPATQRLEFDLCPGCRLRFVADPLGRERVPKPRFSKN